MRKGFTLIEIVLAIALAILLTGAMLWLYRHAANVRVQVSTEIQQINARRMILDRVTEQLRSAIAYPTAGLALEGRDDRILFATTVLPSPSVFNEISVMEQPPPPQQDVQVVVYRLRLVEGERGEAIIAGLESGVQRVPTARVTVETRDEPEDDPEDGFGRTLPQLRLTLLAPEIRFIRFQYFDGSSWQPSWPGGDLPRAVEVAIGYKPLPEGVDAAEYPHKMHRRVVHVHSARREQIGGVIRGLGGAGGLR